MTTPQIQQLVCAHFDITIGDLLSHRRTEQLSWARHVAIWLVLRSTDGAFEDEREAFKEIAPAFNRCYQAIRYSERRVNEWTSTYPVKAAELVFLQAMLVEREQALKARNGINRMTVADRNAISGDTPTAASDFDCAMAQRGGFRKTQQPTTTGHQ